MADRQRGGLRILTGEGHDLGEGLRAERGGSAGARVIGEDPLDDRLQLGLGGAFRLGGFEAGSRLGPTRAPDADRLTMEVELPSNLIVGLACGSEADDLEATEQLLGGVLAASQMVEQQTLSWGQLDGKRARAGHQIDS